MPAVAGGNGLGGGISNGAAQSLPAMPSWYLPTSAQGNLGGAGGDGGFGNAGAGGTGGAIAGGNGGRRGAGWPVTVAPAGTGGVGEGGGLFNDIGGTFHP